MCFDRYRWEDKVPSPGVLGTELVTAIALVAALLAAACRSPTVQAATDVSVTSAAAPTHHATARIRKDPT